MDKNDSFFFCQFSQIFNFIERNTEIEKNNRILLEKITNILRHKHHCSKDAMVNFVDKNEPKFMKTQLKTIKS